MLNATTNTSSSSNATNETLNGLRVYRIPSDNWAILLDRLEKLTRRCVKLGLRVPRLTYLETVMEKTDANDASGGKWQEFVKATIESVPVCINGYTFVASVDLSDDPAIGRIVNRVPNVMQDVSLPREYRETTGFCDHCKTARRRSTVFILFHEVTQTWSQVGRNCLGQFLGGVDPQSVVASMELEIDFFGIVGNAENSDYFGARQSDFMDTTSVLMFTTFVISQLGWLSRSKASDFETPTADYVMMAFNGSPNDTVERLQKDFKMLDDSEKDEIRTKVGSALKWVRSIPDTDNENDYILNLKTLCRQECFNRKYIGTVCSLMATYDREVLKEREREYARQNPSAFVGTIGVRMALDVTVLKISEHYGNYGIQHRVTMKDNQGNDIVWWASNPKGLEEGRSYTLQTNIKKHTVWNGKNQTELTRAKVVKTL